MNLRIASLCLASLALLALPVPARAQDVPDIQVSLDFEDTPLEDAVSFVRDISGVNVVLDPGAEDVSVSLRLRSIALDDALTILTDCAGLERSVYGGVVYLHPEDASLIPGPSLPEDDGPDLELGRTLEAREVTINFSQMPFSEAMGFIQEVSGLNLVLSRAALEHLDEEVTLQVKDLSLYDALTLISQQVECTFRIHAGAVLVCQPGERVVPAPVMGANVQGVKARLRDQRITINLNQTPLEEAIDFFQAITGLNYVLSADAAGLSDEPITLHLRDLALADAMTLVLQQAGCDWQVTNEVVHVDAIED